MKIRYAALPLLVLCLTACGNKTPQCSDEKTIDLVTGIVYDELTGKNDAALEKARNYVSLAVSQIRTNTVDEKTGKVSCHAKLEAQLQSTSEKMLGDLVALGSLMGQKVDNDLEVKGTKISTDVEYTSQLTDDKHEHLVELGGFKGLTKLIGQVRTLEGVKAMSEAPPSSDSKTDSAPSADSEIAAAKAAPKRNVVGVTLQAFECGDTCQLKYVDSNGNSQSAICTDTKGCQSWAEGPKGFMPLIGAKADLVIGKKYIPEGGVTMDNVVGISLADVDPPASSK